MKTNDSQSSRSWTPSRRTALKGGMAAAAIAGSHSVAQAMPMGDPPDYRRWLLDRVTFGWTSGEDRELWQKGWQQYLQDQFNWTAITDTAAETSASQICPVWNMTYFDAWNYAVVINGDVELGKVHGSCLPVIMGWQSKRQLLYVMSDFWSNFFNRFLGQELQFIFWPGYEYETFYSPNVSPTTGTTGQALGNFKDLLRGSAKGMSMLWYLNLYFNTKGNVNENYARELMELHTVGLVPYGGEPAFTEPDVVAAANILTGWRSHWVFDALAFLFEFDKDAWDGGTHQVLGTSFPPPADPNLGFQQGENLLDFLAGRQSTAFHVATRLCEWFIGDDCDPVIVDNVRDAFYTSNGDIQATLLELFSPNTHALATAPGTGCVNYRRPLNLTTHFLRATGPDFAGAQPQTNQQSWKLLDQLTAMGQRPGYKPSPDGYPGENTPWYGAIQPRLELLTELAHTNSLEIDLTNTAVNAFFGATPVSGYAQRVNDKVAGGFLSAAEIASIQSQVTTWSNSGSFTTQQLKRETLALVFSSPSMQFLG